jgi:KH/beta-lactamase-domain protein
MHERTLSEYRTQLTEEVPENAEIDGLRFEGPQLVVYTSTPEVFAEDDRLIGRLASSLQKRLTVRPTADARTTQGEAKGTIERILSDDAGIRDIEFHPETGEVMIEAEKPGLVIGRGGETKREIAAETGWTVEVVRTPPMESETVANVRDYLTRERGDRREFLERVGEGIHSGESDPEWVRVSTLGCCREVGRASFVLSTANTRVLIDCGDKPGAEGEVPYLQAPEAMPLTDIDAVVLTHAHLDHSALLPILFKYGYDGPIYLTEPTRDLMGLLQLDYLDVAAKQGRTPPYDSGMVRKALKHTIPVEYGDVTDIAPDVKLTLRNAGHILGSASAHFHVGDGFHNVAFSGDVHYTDTRLFNGADNDFPRSETLVMESTYGRRGDYSTDQEDAERNLIDVIGETVENDGTVVIPAFAVGRSQEMLLVLADAMRTGDLPTLPVYLDGMIREATAIHTAYPEYLRDGLRERILYEDENPFLADQFHHVDGGSEQRQDIADGEPAIILSTSGMVTGGPIFSWLDLLGTDPDNSLVFVGYQAEGTMGRRIQQGRREVTLPRWDGGESRVTLQLRVESVSGFSGHADRNGLMDYVRTMNDRPDRVLCVHGDETATNQFSSALYEEFGMATYQPRNLETFRCE